MLTEQISGLTRFVLSYNQKVIYLKRGKDSSFPQVIIVFLSNGQKGQINNDTKIQTIFLRDKSLALAKRDTNLGPLYSNLTQLVQTERGYSQAEEILRQIQMNYPRYIMGNYTTVGLDAFYQMLFKVAKIKESVFQTTFGVPAPKKTIENQFQVVDGCLKIFIPSSVPNRDIYILPLQHAHKLLQTKRMGYLIENVPITVRAMKNKELGWYDTLTGELSINKNYEKFDPVRMMETIIHEFGHRLEYEYFTQQQKSTLTATYKNALSSARKGWAQDDLKTVSRMQSARQIFYKGRNLTYASNSPYRYVKHDRKKVVICSINKPTFILSGSPEKFERFYIDNDTEPVVPGGGRQLDKDFWVTTYAMKDEHEFFCESFCFWVSGKLTPNTTGKKALIAWLEDLVKPNQRG